MQVVILLLFLALPLLELAVMIKVGAMIGVWPTILLLILAGIVGGLIIQVQGLSALRRTMDELQRGEPPLEPMMDGALLCFAGGLFLVPGFITDVLAAALLIPPLRLILVRWALGNAVIVTRTVHTQGSGEAPDRETGPYADGPVIEGEFKRIDDPKGARPGQPDPRS